MSESANTQQYTVNNADSDGSNFKLPGDQPGEEPFDLELNDAQHYRWYVHIDNGFDVSVDVTVEGSHVLDSAANDTLDSPVSDGSTITVSNGNVDFIDGTTGHSTLTTDASFTSTGTHAQRVLGSGGGGTVGAAGGTDSFILEPDREIVIELENNSSNSARVSITCVWFEVPEVFVGT